MGLELPTLKWDMRFLELAEKVASWSKDPSTKVGAVIVSPKKRIVSVGYNGFAHGLPDDEEMLVDREIKLLNTIHAEENALLFADSPVEGCTIYVYPFLPCGPCAAKLAQKDIARAVSYRTHVDRWLRSINEGKKTFQRRQIDVTEYEFE
jgi:dCMP deaminase